MGHETPRDWLNSSPYNVYIARECKSNGLEGSKWQNDYKISDYGLEECLRRYRNRIVEGIDEHGVKNTLWNDLHELIGMTLGCWCDPDSCHGHILRDLI